MVSTRRSAKDHQDHTDESTVMLDDDLRSNLQQRLVAPHTNAQHDDMSDTGSSIDEYLDARGTPFHHRNDGSPVKGRDDLKNLKSSALHKYESPTERSYAQERVLTPEDDGSSSSDEPEVVTNATTRLKFKDDRLEQVKQANLEREALKLKRKHLHETSRRQKVNARALVTIKTPEGLTGSIEIPRSKTVLPRILPDQLLTQPFKHNFLSQPEPLSSTLQARSLSSPKMKRRIHGTTYQKVDRRPASLAQPMRNNVTQVKERWLTRQSHVRRPIRRALT